MIAAINYRREILLILEGETPALELSSGQYGDLPPGEYLVTGRRQIDALDCYELDEAYVVEARPELRLVVRTVPAPIAPGRRRAWAARQRLCR